MPSEASGLQFLNLLGSGYEADVYEVLNLRDGQRYALRRVKHASVRRVDKQGLAMELVRHPSLLHPVGRRWSQDGRLEELTPLVQSVDAAQVIRTGGPVAALGLLIQAASGLVALHNSGLVHRDVKPENLLVEETGIEGQWKSHRLVIADLGLVAASQSTEFERGLSGTPGFMAPEVASGSPHSAQSDQFSLGCWLYWAITGKHLLLCGTPELTIRKTIEFPGVDCALVSDRGFESRFWNTLFARLLDPSPNGRFSDTLTLLAYLLDGANSISTDSHGLLELVWNPLAMLPEELTSIRDACTAEPDSSHPRVTIIRLSRIGASWEALRIIQSHRALWSPDTRIAGPSSDPLEVLKSLDRSTPEVLVIEDGSMVHGLSDEALALVIQRFAHKEHPGRRLVVLECGEGGPSRLGLDGQCSAGGSTELIESDPPLHGSLRDWSRTLFSSLPVDESVIGSLVNFGVLGTTRLHRLLSSMVADDALQFADGRISWRPERLPQVREMSRTISLASRDSLQPPATDIDDLFETMPEGLTDSLVSRISLSLAGFPRAFRELLAKGLLLPGPAGGGVRSGAAPRAMVSRSVVAHDNVSVLASSVLAIAADAGEELSEATRVALQLRAGVATRVHVVRALQIASEYLILREPRSALALLDGVRRSIEDELPAQLRARAFALRGRAFSQLGEFELTAGAWEKAKRDYVAQSRRIQAARSEFERMNQQLEIRAGFTRGARELLRGDWRRRSVSYNLFLESEELNLEGYAKGFRTVEPKMVELEARGEADARLRAAIAIALARAALETNKSSEARSLGEKGLQLAEQCKDRALIARALGFLAVLEQSLGRISESEVLSVRREEFLGDARWTQRASNRSLRAGVAYEQGRVIDVVNLERENQAEAVLAKHERLELSARRNLALAYLQMNWIGQAFTMLDSLGAVLRRHTELMSSATRIGELESVRCGVLLEVGLPAEALSGARGRRASIVGQSGLSGTFLLRLEAIALGRLGDAAESESAFSEVLREFMLAGAVDEQMETEVLRIQESSGHYSVPSDLEKLREIEAKSRARGLVRIQLHTRLVYIQKDQRLSPASRLELASALRMEADALGMYRIGLEALFEELSGHIDFQRLESAARSHAEAMQRLKAVSEGLRDYPAYRDAYFRDPRRQRFLEAGRRIAAMR